MSDDPNPNDLQAAFKVLTEHVGRKRGYQVVSTTRLFEDTEELKAAIQSNSLDVVIVDAWTYASMNPGPLLNRVFTSTEAGRVGKQYVLLTGRGSGLDRLADLRGRELLLYEVANTSLGRHWLETLLLAGRLGAPETFFRGVTSVGKPSAAVLPVFFGGKPACVVDLVGLELMKELNPQVGRRLQVVATSDSLVDGFICLRNSAWTSAAFKADLIQALEQLHEEAAGRQLLSLVKASRLLRLKEEHLTGIEKLRATFERLRKEAQP